jgi:hypothetical protein
MEAGDTEPINNIFHKNREISILTVKKVNTCSGIHRKNQTREDRKTNKNTHTKMNKSASLIPVQGPSTVACMIVT